MDSHNDAPMMLAGLQYRANAAVIWLNSTNSSSGTIGLDSCNRTLYHGEHESAESQKSRWVEIICYPMVLMLCTTGNVLIFAVLCGSRPRTTADIYMMALAVTDALVMWIRMPLWILLVSPNLSKTDPTFAYNTTVYSGIYIWLSMTLYALSDGIVLTFAIERILLTVNPMSPKGHLQPRTAVKIIAAIFAFGLLLFTATGVDYFARLAAGQDIASWDETMRPKWLADWVAIQTGVVVALVFVAFVATPSANLILTAWLVKRRLNRSRDLGRNASAEQLFRSGTRIAFACACLFTVCQTPAIVFLGLTIADRAPFCSIHFTANARFTLGEVVWLCASLYYTMNFYMYLAISHKFRKQLLERFPIFSRLACATTPGTAECPNK
ncbi:hypothetical protein BV898_00353 [Hypsibius exemplaris]|uniref:G-protein coupled receptors family 1 profile domain-containing protein n=1 Tax=Hypsibius exemplaris TaxID=2072580 RepID=A0A1W0XFP1_HYPEX|nr:hypothetical protein BV898_00353 [Hypsibius exemplaris]